MLNDLGGLAQHTIYAVAVIWTVTLALTGIAWLWDRRPR